MSNVHKQVEVKERYKDGFFLPLLSCKLAVSVKEMSVSSSFRFHSIDNWFHRLIEHKTYQWNCSSFIVLVMDRGVFKTLSKSYPVDNYMFKVINRNTRTRCDICLKLTIKTPNDTNGIVVVPYFYTLFLTFYC